jgi:hypothetical protein
VTNASGYGCLRTGQNVDMIRKGQWVVRVKVVTVSALSGRERYAESAIHAPERR